MNDMPTKNFKTFANIPTHLAACIRWEVDQAPWEGNWKKALFFE